MEALIFKAFFVFIYCPHTDTGLAKQQRRHGGENEVYKDAAYSFGELQVIPVAKEYLAKKERLNHTFVYDDGIVKGMVFVERGEIKKLYVDNWFQNQGIGAKLLKYAVEEREAVFLWALEKNVRAIKFYQRHGFCITDQRMLEEGTTEYLVKLENSRLINEFI